MGFLNKDAQLDVAIDSADGSVYVLLGNGARGFSSVTPYEAGNSPVEVTIGGFNRPPGGDDDDDDS